MLLHYPVKFNVCQSTKSAFQRIHMFLTLPIFLRPNGYQKYESVCQYLECLVDRSILNRGQVILDQEI